MICNKGKNNLLPPADLHNGNSFFEIETKVKFHSHTNLGRQSDKNLAIQFYLL